MIALRLFDLHCDTLYECNKRGCNLDNKSLHIHLDAAQGFESYTQCFGMFVPDTLRGEAAVMHINRLLSCLKRQKELFPDFFRYCQPILTVEGGAALGGKLENINWLRENGVRAITLTWNGENELAGGVMSDAGFSDFGKKAVGQMEKCGIIADVSHLNERSFYELCAFAGQPFIATHSASKTICGNRRNLTDEQFLQIRERGGIVGIVMCDKFLRDGENAGFEDILKHVDHFLSLGGENTLAFGSDFDGTDMPDGIVNISSLFSLYEFLLKRGISEAQLDKIFYLNAHDFFEKHGGLS